MEQDKLHKQVAQTKMWAMIAVAVGVLVLGATFYFGNQLLMKLPKPTRTPVLEMPEMTFTIQNQKDLLKNHDIVEVKFEWKSTERRDTTALTLVAVGGYLQDGKIIWDDANKVPLQAEKNYYYSDASRYNFRSPIYYNGDSWKAMQRIELTDPLEPGKIIVDITMIPSTTSDATREYCVYYEGRSVYDRAPANPAPPFSSIYW